MRGGGRGLGVVVGWAEPLGGGRSDNQWGDGSGGRSRLGEGSVMGGAGGEQPAVSLCCSCGRTRPPRNRRCPSWGSTGGERPREPQHGDGDLWVVAVTRSDPAVSSPFRRLGTSSDVAEVVAFLCSPAASYVVGETVVVAGGTPSRL